MPLRKAIFTSIVGAAALAFAPGVTRGQDANQRAPGDPSLQWTSSREGMIGFLDAAFGAGQYVIVGYRGHIWTSPDGVSWTRRQNPDAALRDMQGVTFGGGRFVAVGGLEGQASGVVLTSPDGLVWTLRDVSAAVGARGLHSVAYGNGLYVAVGGLGRLVTSPDGSTWSPVGSSTTSDLLGVAYGGGRWVAVGQAGTVVTSVDGSVWEPALPGGARVTEVIHTGTQFVGVGDGIWTSPDGLAWTRRVQFGSFFDVAAGGGRFVVDFYSNPDSPAWSPSIIARVDPGSGVPSNIEGAIAYGSAGFVKAGRYGSIFVTPDGVAPWTSRTLPASRWLNAAAAGDTVLCAVGSYGAVASSADAVTWTNEPTAVTAFSGASRDEWRSIAWGNGRFVMIGDSKAGTAFPMIMTSPDCSTWTDQNPGVSNKAPGAALAFGAGRFVAVGSYVLSGNSVLDIRHSTDGATWTLAPTGFPSSTFGSLGALAFGAGRFVALGNSADASLAPLLTTSPDGITWTAQAAPFNPTAKHFTAVAYGGGRFVAAATGSQTWISTDGLSWSLASGFPPANEYVRSLAYGAGRFVAITQPIAAVGQFSTRRFSSADGQAWQEEIPSSDHPTRGVAYTAGAGLFVAVGSGATSHASGLSAGGRFHTVTPCRLIDTRAAAGPFGGPALTPGADRAFPVVGQCGIPATARAVSVNVTATQPSQAGHFRLFPTSLPLPQTSVVNYSTGQTRANSAVLNLGASGRVSVRCGQTGGTAHLVLDVNGYFE